MSHERSREAYAREHGLSARTMFVNVHSRRMNAAMHRWNVEFNKIVQFKIHAMQEKLERDIVSKLPISVPMYKGIYHIADDWHAAPKESTKPTFTVMEPAIFRGVFVGDNRANVVYTKLPDGKVAMDTENCEHRWMCPGPCKHCNNPEGRRL